MEIRVVIAESRGVSREGMCKLFAGQQGMKVVGEADDGQSTIPLAGTLLPDVIIMMVHTRGVDGIDATRQIVSAHPSVRIVGMSADLDVHGVREFLAAGGAGFITKGNSFTEFVRAVQSVTAKRIYLSPDVADALVSNYVLKGAMDRSNPAPMALSVREREVLQLVVEGMTTKAAAAVLKVSPKTVDMHRQRIMSKLKIYSVAELTKYAIREGIATLQ